MRVHTWVLHIRVLQLVLPVAASLVTVSSLCDGATITVSGAGSDYATIGEAVVSAVAGDTVRVASGAFAESVELKSGVVLQGDGYQTTRIELDTASPVLAYGVVGAVLRGFAVAYTGNGSSSAVSLSASQVVISDCRILSNPGPPVVHATGESALTLERCVVEDGGTGILLSGGSRGIITDNQIRDNERAGVEFADASYGEIVGNTIGGSGIHGITVRASGPVDIRENVLAHNDIDGILCKNGAAVEIRHNTVVANGSWGIQIISGTVATVVDNIVVGHRGGGITTLRGAEDEGTIAEIGYNDVWDNGTTYRYHEARANYGGLEPPISDLSVNPLFFDPDAGDYRLRSSSWLIDAGSDGGTVGALDAVSPIEEVVHPSTVAVQAFPDPAYWHVLQGEAWLPVDLYLQAGSDAAFVPDEVEVHRQREDGSIIGTERIAAADFRWVSEEIERDLTNLWSVFDATLTGMTSLTSVEVPRGGRALFFPTLGPLSPSALPARVEYVVRGHEGGIPVELRCEVTPVRLEQPTEYRLPLRGGGWHVTNGPPLNDHRQKGRFTAGTWAAPGRYAVDIYRAYRRMYRTDGRTREDYWGYGAPVYAPAAGVVLWARGDYEQPEPGGTIEGVGTNGVLIDHEDGTYSGLYHFKTGSVVVEAGQRIDEGDLVGQLGGSGVGSRWDPHLHLEVTSSPDWPTEGLPVAFRDLRIEGTEIQDGQLFENCYFEGASRGPVLSVAADGSEDFVAIAEAMAIAVSGDTVRVQPGTYSESLWLKSGVVLQGSGYEHTRIELDAPANPVYANGVTDAVISGLTVAYTGPETVAAAYLSSSRVRMSDCRITGHPGSSVVFATDESAMIVERCVIQQGGIGILLMGGSEATIRDSWIRDNQSSGVEFADASHGEIVGTTVNANGIHGVTVRGAGPVDIRGSVLRHNELDGILAKNGARLDIRGNTLVANGAWGIQILSEAVAAVVDNLVASNGSGGITTLRGAEAEGTISEIGYNDVWDNGDIDYQNVQTPASDLSLDPLFVDPDAADYRLRTHSPLAGAASDGGVIGALPVALPGDFNGDGAVDFRDFFLFVDAFGTTDPDFDLDDSGRVDFDDFFLFVDNFGRTETSDPGVRVIADEG